MKINSEKHSMLSLYNLIKTKEINLNPIYQRTEGVWLVDDQELLINSIIDYFPIPNIFFRKMNDNGCGKFDCVDGKQRLTTIRNFMEGKITVEIDGNKYKYLDLPSKYRKKFDDRKIGVHIISNASDKEIKIVFDRLQRGTNLKPSEILKTLDSEYVKKVNDYMSKFTFLIPNEDGTVILGIREGNKRSDIFGLILKVIVLEIEQSDIKTEDVKSFLNANKVIDPLHKNKVEKIEKIFNYLQNTFTNENFGNIKSLYAFVTIYYLLSLVYDKKGEQFFGQLNDFIKDLIFALSTSKNNVPTNLSKFIKIKEISQEGWDTKQKILERNNILLSIINEEQITNEEIIDDSFLLYNYKNNTNEIYNTINALVNLDIGYNAEVISNTTYPRKFDDLKKSINNIGDFKLFIGDAYTIIYESYRENKIPKLQDRFKKNNILSELYWLNEFRTFLLHNPDDTQGRYASRQVRDQGLTEYIKRLSPDFTITEFNNILSWDIFKLSLLKNYLLIEYKNFVKEVLAKN